MKQITDFTIIQRRSFGDSYFSLTLLHPDSLPPIQPGQFVEVQVPRSRDVFLRRPISIYDVDTDNNTLSLLIQIVGRGTRTLADLAVGDSLNVIFPLGHGFDIVGSHPLLVGGGAGIAPLLYLSRCYSLAGIRPAVFLGGRSASLIPNYEAFAPFADVFFATDDGSLGHHGLVTQHPRFQLDRFDHVAACGPTPMLKAVARIARDAHVPCSLSLENMMACGLGACLCCVANTDQGHLCVCHDGPVFDAAILSDFLNS